MAKINEIIAKIKSKGYWNVKFHPLKSEPDLIPSRTKVKELLEKNVVELRGWDYPHIPSRNDEIQEIYFGNDYCEGHVDFGHSIEAWRFYQSGQFIHYKAMWEDWHDKENLLIMGAGKYGSILSAIGVVYTMTEVFEFLRRLTQGSNIFDTGVMIKIKLWKIDNRKLVILDQNRLPFIQNYVANIPDIEFIKEVGKEIILNQSKELALEGVQYIFETFGWENQPIEVFKTDQQKLLEGKI